MTLLSLAVVVALLLGMAGLVGSRLEKTHVAASQIRLPNVSLDSVWEMVFDFEHYPTWRPGLRRVERGPEIDGHPTWFEYCGPGVKVQLQFVAIEPKSRLTSRLVGENLPIFGAWEYQFAEEAADTVVTITERDKVYNPLLRVCTRLAFPHHAAMDVYLTALARHCGCEAVPTHQSIKLENSLASQS